jgi:putative ABC transport system permease protein
MDLYHLSKTAVRSMTANKVRTALTALGMIIGITAIMIVFSAGEGVRQLLNSQIESFGTNIIHTEIKAPTNKSRGNMDHEGALSIAGGTQITTLKLSDLEEIKKLPNVTGAYGVLMGQDLATYGSYRKKVSLMGVSADYINIDKSKIEEGRFFDDAEDKSLAKVAVIGSKIKADFFGNEDPLGKEIKIGKNKFLIIGTIEPRGGGMGVDYDTYVYVPIRTIQKKVLGIDYLLYMETALDDMSKQYFIADEMRQILRRNHDIVPDIDPATGEALTNKDDFRIVTMEEMLSILGTVSSAITYLLLGIVAISLLVGGVGIMNIMYVIVSERTREIGLRKAVGAKLHDILGQFLLESVFVTLFAAIVGIALGTGISFLIAVIAQSQNLAWDFIMPLRAYITAISFSIIFGVVFGLLPARKAAKMDPITALRNE